MLKEYADFMQTEIAAAKLNSSLPRETNKEAINKIVADILS